MSTSAISVSLRTAVTGLQTTQSALATTSNNIANANTAGFTRKTVNLESVLIDGQGAGVSIGSVTREVNQFLLRDVRLQTTALGEAEVRHDFFSSMQDMFGPPDSGSSLSATITSLANKLEAMAIDPSSSNAQIGVVSAAQSLTRQFNDMARTIQDLRYRADQDIADGVARVNQLLDNIAELNVEISRNTALNLPTGDMEDQRDLAVAELASLMDISYFTRENNQIVVFMASGRPLVDRTAATLSYDPASVMSSQVSYPGGGIDGIEIDGTDITADIDSGRLRGLIDMRDTELPNLGAELDRLAGTLKEQINAIHNDGSPLPPLATLTGERTFATPAATTVSFTGTVRLAVLNADGTLAGSAFDFSFADLATVVGGAPTVNQIRDAINGTYAGSVPAIPGLAGATASVNADGQLVIAASVAGRGIAINEGTSRESVTGYGFSHYFGLNNLFVGDSVGGIANNLAVRADILADPQKLSRGSLSEAALASGAIALTAGDGSVAQLLADKFNERLSFAAAGGLPANTTTFSGYGASILSDNATRAANAEDNALFRQTLLADIQAKSDSFSGVNTDEEMANLLMYQNAYAASARVITTLSEMLKMLTEIV